MTDVRGQLAGASQSEPAITSSGRRSCVILTAESQHGAAAQAWAARLFDLRAVERLRRGDAFPEALAAELLGNGIDLLISYLNPVIVPGPILRTVRLAAINIHPAPPEWPGVGCVCYALYEGDREFGVTAHIMTESVDQGPIIRVLRFPVLDSDDNESLSLRVRDYSLILYYEVLGELATAGQVRLSGDRWRGPPRTWAEFRRWMTLSSSDPPDEIRRKIRAIAHPQLSGPFVELGAARFAYVAEDEPSPS
jgi:methionyl-tRNA formyltransferase